MKKITINLAFLLSSFILTNCGQECKEACVAQNGKNFTIFRAIEAANKSIKGVAYTLEEIARSVSKHSPTESTQLQNIILQIFTFATKVDKTKPPQYGLSSEVTLLTLQTKQKEYLDLAYDLFAEIKIILKALSIIKTPAFLDNIHKEYMDACHNYENQLRQKDYYSSNRIYLEKALKELKENRVVDLLQKQQDLLFEAMQSLEKLLKENEK